MKDDLIFAVFKEIAAVEGKRNPDGTWNTEDANDVQRLLRRAFNVVRRAAEADAESK
ncbi:MAG: hypothetical protein RKE49_01630 [Oceanicaulis sp.]